MILSDFYALTVNVPPKYGTPNLFESEELDVHSENLID
jgi:hypothetical protein